MADNRENDTFPPPYMAEPKGYGLSGKIILSAIVILFAVVVIMVCLHVYARWYILRARRLQIRRARRRTHLVFYIEPNNPAVPIPARGLNASVLKSLPTFTYDGGDDAEERENGGLECAVSLSEFEEGERGRVLPKCEHSFHVDCIDMWFHSHSTCPICRAAVDGGDFLPENPTTAELAIELTQSQPGPVRELNESTGSTRPELPCSSFTGRRKGSDLVGVSIEVPSRSQSFSFTNSTNSDESGPSRSPSEGFKSPTSRLLSLRRILSREKKLPITSPSAAGTSCLGGGELAAELDVELGVELGRVEETSPPSPALTPR